MTNLNSALNENKNILNEKENAACSALLELNDSVPIDDYSTTNLTASREEIKWMDAFNYLSEEENDEDLEWMHDDENRSESISVEDSETIVSNDSCCILNELEGEEKLRKS